MFRFVKHTTMAQALSKASWSTCSQFALVRLTSVGNERPHGRYLPPKYNSWTELPWSISISGQGLIIFIGFKQVETISKNTLKWIQTYLGMPLSLSLCSHRTQVLLPAGSMAKPAASSQLAHLFLGTGL